MNVCTFSLLLGRRILGDDRERLRLLGLGGLLHDIGMARIDPAIVNKRGSLSPSEWEIILQHPILGHEIAIRHRLPDEVCQIIRCRRRTANSINT